MARCRCGGCPRSQPLSGSVCVQIRGCAQRSWPLPPPPRLGHAGPPLGVRDLLVRRPRRHRHGSGRLCDAPHHETLGPGATSNLVARHRLGAARSTAPHSGRFRSNSGDERTSFGGSGTQIPPMSVSRFGRNCLTLRQSQTNFGRRPSSRSVSVELGQNVADV